MSRKIIFIATLAVLASLSAANPAGSDELLTFYRGADGTLSNQVRSNAVEMMRIARENGHVTLWITLNYRFNVYVDQMTAEEIETQAEEVSEGFSAVLAPLIQRNLVWHPVSGPYIRGPGCTVRATARGLSALLRDERLLQIVAVEEQPG